MTMAHDGSSPLDGAYGWVVVFAAFCINAIVDGITYSFGILHVEFMKAFQESSGYTSYILSTMVGMTLCSRPISAPLTNKYGCRKVTIAASILGAMFLVLSTYAKNVLTLIFAIGIGTGFCLGLYCLPSLAIVTHYFLNHRSLAICLTMCGSGCGAFVFAPILDYFIKIYDWQKTIYLLASIVLCCAIFGALYRPLQITESVGAADADADPSQQNHTCCIDSNIQHPESSSIANDSSGARENVIPNGRAIWTIAFFGSLHSDVERVGKQTDAKEEADKCADITLLKCPTFFFFTLSNFLTSLGLNVPLLFLVPLAEKLNLAPGEGLWLLRFTGFATIFALIVIGVFSDIHGKRRVLVYKYCLIVGGLATILSIFCSGFYYLAAYTMVYGFTMSAHVGLTWVITMDIVNQTKQTNAFGWILLFRGIASIIGSPIAGWLFDCTNSLVPVFIFAGSMIAMSGLLLFAVDTNLVCDHNCRWPQPRIPKIIKKHCVLGIPEYFKT